MLCKLEGNYALDCKSDKRMDETSKDSADIIYQIVQPELHDTLISYTTQGALPLKQWYDIKKEIAELWFENKMKRFVKYQKKVRNQSLSNCQKTNLIKKHETY